MSASWDNGKLFIHHSVSRAATEEYDLHCHHYYEVYYFLDGDAEYLVEGKLYHPSPSSMLLLPPNVFHGVKVLSDRRYERMALHFLPELLHPETAQALLRPFSGQETYFARTEVYHLQDYYRSLLECEQMPPELQSIAISARLEALLTQTGLIALHSEPLRPALDDASDTVRRLIDYVNEHFTQPLSLTELSGRFFLSRNQLNRVFRQATGTTIMDYAARKRIALAQRLISEGETAQSAAAMAGYGDYSNFYRQYRRILDTAPRTPGSALK